jgi:adenylate cyclase
LRLSPNDAFPVAMTQQLQTAMAEWIVGAALAGKDDAAILTGVCERLGAAGVPVLRVSLSGDLLDPILDGRGVRWKRGQGAGEEVFTRTTDAVVSADWKSSPFFRLIESGEHHLRRRLDAAYRRGEFPLLDALQDQGTTDYAAFVAPIGEGTRLGDIRGVIGSWTTDRPGGFSDAEIAVLDRIMPPLALAFMLQTTSRVARTMVTTYLGSDAAQRVLAGNIVRGRAERIRAVVWYADLVGFTRISETVGPEGVLALLNDYAEAQVEAIEAHGGHVLKFMGDGILAFFPDEQPVHACIRALDAAEGQRHRLAVLRGRRKAAGLPVTDLHLALHIGELLYGNVGSPRRLDFTVLGPAVNEAARIESLCGSLDKSVIVSSAFADEAGAARSRLVSLGRYAMKGVAMPQELFTLDPTWGG